MSKNDNNCINEPEINKEDAYILGLEGNIKGYKIGLALLIIIIIVGVLLYIFNPVIIDEAADAANTATDVATDVANETTKQISLLDLKSKIVYITISTIILFTCIIMLGKMFIKSKLSLKLCELRNMINSGYLIIKAAQQRKESRGLHYTLDYPLKNPANSADR